jgi:hypothetical protein
MSNLTGCQNLGTSSPATSLVKPAQSPPPHTIYIYIYITHITKLNQKTAPTVKCFVYTGTRSDLNKLIKVVNVEIFVNKKYIRFEHT